MGILEAVDLENWLVEVQDFQENDWFFWEIYGMEYNWS